MGGVHRRESVRVSCEQRPRGDRESGTAALKAPEAQALALPTRGWPGRPQRARKVLKRKAPSCDRIRFARDWAGAGYLLPPLSLVNSYKDCGKMCRPGVCSEEGFRWLYNSG